MRALLSVSDKTGLVELGRGLARAGGRTRVHRRHRQGAGRRRACRSSNVSDVTGFPEMMDGRVKTLHPAVHGGILARRNRPDDLAALDGQGIRPIDLVVVNLYPFAKAAANPRHPVRRAGRGDRHRRPEHGPRGGQEFPRRPGRGRSGGLSARARGVGPPRRPTLEFRFELMRKAFAHTAEYDGTIAQTLCLDRSVGRDDDPRFDRRKADDAKDACATARTRTRRPSGVPVPESCGPRRWQVHQGKELSYTNLLDLDAAARIALEFTEPAGVVIKHTNPCGVATGASIAEPTSAPAKPTPFRRSAASSG